MRNLSSREENVQKTFEMQVCVSSWNEIHAMRFLVALNILLSLSSSVGNTIILVALKKETTTHRQNFCIFAWCAQICVLVFFFNLSTLFI